MTGSKAGAFFRENQAGVSMVLVAAGLLIGALAGGSLGCFLYTKHMAFLHEGVRPACSESPVILWGGTASGAFIGAACGMLAAVLIYLRGRLTLYYSLAGTILAGGGFALYAISQGKHYENFAFTGAFITLGGLTIGTLAGLIADHLRSRKTD